MADFNYTIKDEVAVLSTAGAWALELNLISWGGRSPKLDLRKWTDTHEKMGKGVTLTDAEAKALRDALIAYFGE